MGDKSYPRRLKRSDSFLGIHFDFHADTDDCNIGSNTTREMIERILDEVRPDYVQCDCKGHRGLSSYPTTVGHPAPGIKADALKIWREVTAERGVSLYMHYSGVWDNEAISRHPDWARRDEEGKLDPDMTSTFGPYADKLLIPQLKELCDVYGVDGVWVDGECWATKPDYSDAVMKLFCEKIGIGVAPKKTDDPYYREYLDFCREGFRSYLRHYVDEIHNHNHDFEVASNWAYTSFMPEPVNISVDFISGDYSLQNSVNSARLEARCIAPQNKPWDLMAWSFTCKFGEGNWCVSTKSATQLKQEAAVVLSMGGGFQSYFQQKKGDGAVALWQMALMKQTAEFCRQRQAYCHRSQAVPQVGLIYSTHSFYLHNPRLFSPWGGQLEPLQGTLQSLLESQYSVEILMEHHLSGRMNEYPLLVVPEWDDLDYGFQQELLDYAREGGNLLIIGPATVEPFREQLGVEFVGEVNKAERLWLEHGGWMAGQYTSHRSVRVNEGTEMYGKLYRENDNIGPHEPAATINSYGYGKIAGVYFGFGERYLHGATPAARDFLAGLVKRLFPCPMVQVSGSHHVDVMVNQLNGSLMVNLVNTSGPHANKDVYVYDEIQSVGPLDITIRTQREPTQVLIQPGELPVSYAYQDGEVRLSLPCLHIHAIVEIRQR